MRQTLGWFSFVALVGLGAAFMGCSNNKTTNPYGGGTGAGGAGSLNVSLAAAGGTGQFTFADAGIVVYKCGIHPGTMRDDSVYVDPSSADTDVNVTVTGLTHPGFSPQGVHIKPGGTVHWTNPTGMAHSVVNQ